MNDTQFEKIQINPKVADRLKRLLTVIDSQAETIPNPDYIEAKYQLNQITEALFYNHDSPYYRQDLWFTSSSQVNNRIKIVEKKTPRDNEFLAAAYEVQKLHNS